MKGNDGIGAWHACVARASCRRRTTHLHNWSPVDAAPASLRIHFGVGAVPALVGRSAAMMASGLAGLAVVYPPLPPPWSSMVAASALEPCPCPLAVSLSCASPCCVERHLSHSLIAVTVHRGSRPTRPCVKKGGGGRHPRAMRALVCNHPRPEISTAVVTDAFAASMGVTALAARSSAIWFLVTAAASVPGSLRRCSRRSCSLATASGNSSPAGLPPSPPSGAPTTPLCAPQMSRRARRPPRSCE